MAAIATFALKPGVWFRRVRLVIVSPDSQRTACLLSGRNSTYRPVQISGTSSLDKSDHLRDRIFWWNRDHHVNVIQHEMAFFDSAFLLQRQLAEDIAEMRSQLPVQGLSPALGNEHNVIFALPLAVA